MPCWSSPSLNRHKKAHRAVLFAVLCSELRSKLPAINPLRLLHRSPTPSPHLNTVRRVFSSWLVVDVGGSFKSLEPHDLGRSRSPRWGEDRGRREVVPALCLRASYWC